MACPYCNGAKGVVRSCDAACYHGWHEDCWVAALLSSSAVIASVGRGRIVIHELGVASANGGGRRNVPRWNKD